VKSKKTNKPIYEKEITGAANTVTNAYNQAAPGLQSGASRFGDIMGGILDRYEAGDPNVSAARTYNSDVLSGKYLDNNPYLQGVIDKTNNSVLNNQQAVLGTRGLTGGSDYMKLAAQALADNEAGLRYQDYGAERDRMGQAVSQVPGIIAAENGILDPAFAAYDAMQAPVRAAAGYGSTIGGLLGQYQVQKSKGSLAGLLAQMAGNAAQAYAGGGS